jgi:hypothetical protein
VSAAPCLGGSQRQAAAEARLARQLLHYGVVVAVLAVVARPAAVMVAFIWGLSLAGRILRRVVEPRLEQRLVEREASRALHRAVPQERRHLEEAHVREVGGLYASIADGIRDPLRAAQGLVRQMGEDPTAAVNVDHARLALRELDRVEASVAELRRATARARAEREGRA